MVLSSVLVCEQAEAKSRIAKVPWLEKRVLTAKEDLDWLWSGSATVDELMNKRAPFIAGTEKRKAESAPLDASICKLVAGASTSPRELDVLVQAVRLMKCRDAGEGIR